MASFYNRPGTAACAPISNKQHRITCWVQQPAGRAVCQLGDKKQLRLSAAWTPNSLSNSSSAMQCKSRAQQAGRPVGLLVPAAAASRRHAVSRGQLLPRPAAPCDPPSRAETPLQLCSMDKHDYDPEKEKSRKFRRVVSIPCRREAGRGSVSCDAQGGLTVCRCCTCYLCAALVLSRLCLRTDL